MFNYLILEDYNGKFMGVIGHDYTIGKLFYKVRNKFIDSLLKNLFTTDHYTTIEDEDMEYIELVEKTNKNYLELVVGKLDQYKVQKIILEQQGDFRSTVREQYSALYVPPNRSNNRV